MENLQQMDCFALSNDSQNVHSAILPSEYYYETNYHPAGTLIVNHMTRFLAQKQMERTVYNITNPFL